MQRLKSMLLASCAALSFALSITGCAPIGHVHAQSVDCRSCHAPDGGAGARDFSHIYANPSSHHPVGVKYPADLNANYSLPNGQSAGVAFFDRNGNGQPDNDEIQLFGEGGAATVECASCHREHGNTLTPADTNFYLRLDNSGSALCTTCHHY